MAENSARAFGRYLKMLRERRQLSLYEVSSLSETFPESIGKGYLSRCENGLQKLAFPKLIALSRIYEVPADVLVERMELDLELDRVGGPDTEGMTFSEMNVAGKKTLDTGEYWPAYGLCRDSILRATSDPVMSLYRDRSEQFACSQMNCATTATSLGRFRYALHEFRHLEEVRSFGPVYYPVILERIAFCYMSLREHVLATEYADSAIRAAAAFRTTKKLGYLYSTRARLALEQSDLDGAARFYHKAYRNYRDNDRRSECAMTLNSLAHCFLQLKRHRAAQRALEASRRLSEELDQQRSLAITQMMLGEIDEFHKKHELATKRWKEASHIARRLNDRILRFKAEFSLFKQALAVDDAPRVRSIQRRLNRLAPWVPPGTEELAAFRALLDGGHVFIQQRVAKSQPPNASPNN